MGVLVDGARHSNGKILRSFLGKFTVDQHDFVIMFGLIVRYLIEKLKRCFARLTRLFKGDNVFLIGAENIFGKGLARFL